VAEAVGSPGTVSSDCQGEADELLVPLCGVVPWLFHLAWYGRPAYRPRAPAWYSAVIDQEQPPENQRLEGQLIHHRAA
jgi:hypothetical protein